jgi:putative NIF3 family GTP cyclohydrolase 1 type 2
VRSSSFSVEKRIKIDMPVDTGRARASWGHWTPVDIVKQGNWTADDAHWAEKDGGLTIEQGSNVSYIVHLNQGTSQQAPAAFIDKAADAGARELTNELLREIGDLL